MAKNDKRRHMREKIADMVLNIEAVILNINNVLGEVTVLVNEIDSITERLEKHYGSKAERRECKLDANRNRCDVSEAGRTQPQSKLTTPSPYMDYTFLDLSNECATCVNNVHSFTFNEKYPLWIQNDTWKFEHSISEISEVSTGSDSNNCTQYGSDDKSWRSISNIGRNNENIYMCAVTLNTKSKFDVEDVVKFSKCCKSSHHDLSDDYCGVYEQIMEQQLEDLEQMSCVDVEKQQSSDNEISECSSDKMSGEFIPTDLIISEYLIPFANVVNNQHRNVIVREFSDSCASTI